MHLFYIQALQSLLIPLHGENVLFTRMLMQMVCIIWHACTFYYAFFHVPGPRALEQHGFWGGLGSRQAAKRGLLRKTSVRIDYAVFRYCEDLAEEVWNVLNGGKEARCIS